jgi:hypothetical protein
MDASLVTTGDTRTFLVYQNYESLLGYNCAHYYALSVALLADSFSRPRSARRNAPLFTTSEFSLLCSCSSSVRGAEFCCSGSPPSRPRTLKFEVRTQNRT